VGKTLKFCKYFFPIYIVLSLLAVTSSAEQFILPLPSLAGYYKHEAKQDSFDFQKDFSYYNILDISIICCGKITSGLARGDGIERDASEVFPLPGELMFLTENIDSKNCYAYYHSNAPDCDTIKFQSFTLTNECDFIKDGKGLITAQIAPPFGFGFDVIDLPSAQIDSVFLSVITSPINNIKNNYIQDLISLSTYPNPFNHSTKIVFELNRPNYVRIEIYDQMGSLVEVITNRYYSNGKHDLVWNAQSQSNGIYFCLIKTNSFEQVKKITLIK
jgi:hypothetical protein